MRITRRQLRRIILENILEDRALNENYDLMSRSGLFTGEHGLFGLDDGNNEAVLVHIKGTEYGKGKIKGSGAGNRPAKAIMDAISRAVAKDLSGSNYYLWKGLDDFWANGATGKLPVIGRRGDPYLYMRSSSDGDGRVRVVGGPVARAIGKEMSASKLQAQEAFIVNTQTNDETTGETRASKTESDIEYWPGFDKEILSSYGNPSSESDMVVGKCKQGQCAEWVGDLIDDAIGNAWHALNRAPLRDKKIFSAFDDMSDAQFKEAAEIFSIINRNPEGNINARIRNFIGELIPDKNQFKSLQLGDIVGLTYYPSNNWTKAFYESATGFANLGSGRRAAKGPFFATVDGERWNSKMIGKNITFRPGTNWRNQGLGTNFTPHTHVGIVGAKHNGIPIIYHNIHRNVTATGLNATRYSGTGITIVWAASNPNTANNA